MNRSRWIVLALVFLLASCSSIPSGIDNPGYAQLSPVQLLSNIPFFPQVEEQCGPASLATVLANQGVEITPEQLRGKLYIPGKEGAVTTEMIARARRYQMLAYVLEPKLVDILSEVEAGNPVLVMQNLGFNWFPKWHFSVVVGYDLNERTIALRSGDKRAYKIDVSLFMRTWRRAESWAMVVLPSGSLPVTAKAERIISAATDFERLGEHSAALAIYRSVISRWPDTQIAYFGAGNSAYALGQHQASNSFFTSYLARQPNIAAGWNNMAYNLVQLGCGSQSLQAIQCAVDIAPDNPWVLESRDELRLLTQDIRTESRCPLIECPKD